MVMRMVKFWNGVRGLLTRILQEERTYVPVEIKWDKECLREGDREVSRERVGGRE
jgi:hypothetical protein